MVPLLQTEKLCKSFRVKNRYRSVGAALLPAVVDVDLTIARGRTLGLVGESGCGKSTLGKTIMGLLQPDSGRVTFDGTTISGLSARQMRPFRQQMQMVFQDPYASLNPRLTVFATLAEPFKIHTDLGAAAIADKVMELLDCVGLTAQHARRYPHEFSGGQRQRIGIARALALTPRLIIADEPVSALDLSIQAQIINLMQDLQQRFNLTYLFISHDLCVVEHLCDEIAVMYLGRIVEQAPVDDFFRQPLHPYGEMLLQALPLADPTRKQHNIARGEVPSALQPPAGCPFHPRCPYASAICKEQLPPLDGADIGRRVACHHAGQLHLNGIVSAG